MKNIRFASQEAGYKVLAALAALAAFAAAGIFLGLVMPGHRQFQEAPCIFANISVGSALLVWSIFCLIKPARYSRGWKIAELTLVPLYWLVLILAAYVCLGWLIAHSIQQIEDLTTPTLL